MQQFYRDKTILVTGTTGFLGKVLLEKILYSLSEVRRVYVLIRTKKGSSLTQRFKKEIMSSPCFDRIRSIYSYKFEEFIEDKVQPIQGDLHKDGLGLNKNDFQELTNNCQIIINCAASIDFNARLDQAIESNIKGTLRMMELGRSCKKLQIFTHVSTCYTNCIRSGLIHEQIYDDESDPQGLFNRLTSMPIRDLVNKTPTILNKYPNTYTFTKSLCQKIIKVRKGNLPMCIVRPSIINNSYLEPFPGWIDSIAAGAAYFMFVGLGIVKQVQGGIDGIGDFVPVDLVVGTIIVATAYNAHSKALNIYHASSSDRNPICFREVMPIIHDFWNANKSQSRVSESKTMISKNQSLVQLYGAVRTLPIWMYTKVSPIMGGQHAKNAQRLMKAEKRAVQIKKIFHFFVNDEWIFECNHIRELQSILTQKQRSQYLIDCADINMRYFITTSNYGIQKYILKENIQLPTSENSNLLRMPKPRGLDYFSDVKWALSGDIQKTMTRKQLKNKILTSSKILSVIENQTNKRLENSHRSFEQEKKIIQNQALAIISELMGQFKIPVVRFMAWTLHKVFKSIYEKVNINSEMLEVLRDVEKDNIPIILLPNHRSYMDFLIVSYIFFVYHLKIPRIISDETLLNTYLIPFIIKSSGAFFFKSATFKKSPLYQAIYREYLHNLLATGNNLQFFIEGARSRTGKIQHPHEEILDILVSAVEQSIVHDLCLVPLTINYEKVLEGDTFPAQLLGEQKVEESLFRVIKAIPLLKANFGRVYVEIDEPFFLNQYLQSKKSRTKQIPQASLCRELANHIIYRLNQKLVIMSTGVVSAVLLMYRKGISEDLLMRTVNLITKLIAQKGYKIGAINENSSAFAVRNAIAHLQTITLKTKKSIFEIQINAGNQFHKILMLSYYRNTISHAFLPEAFLGCAFLAFGEQLYLKEGISLARLQEETIFIMGILQKQYLHPYELEENGRFSQLLSDMMKFSLVEAVGEDKWAIKKQSINIVVFYCSLLRAAIQCYWAVTVYLLTIANREDSYMQFANLRVFYDEIQWFMESFYEQKVLDCYQSCSLETIRNCLEKFGEMKLVKIQPVSKKQTRVYVAESRDKLSQMQVHLKNFLRNISHSSISSPVDMAKNTGVGIEYFSKM